MLRHFVPLAVAVTAVAGLGFALAQQDLRLSADDVPAATAQDAAGRLAAGVLPQQLPMQPVDLATSFTPWVAVYDADRHLVKTGASLDGQPIAFPTSVFDSVTDGRDNRVTWQPRDGVRMATVTITWHDGDQHGWVVAGRSLRTVEEHEDAVRNLAIAGWLATLVAVALAVGAAHLAWRPRA